MAEEKCRRLVKYTDMVIAKYIKEKGRSLVSKRAASWGDYTISLPGERKMSLVAKKK